jgi:hypothetical protein
MKENSNLTVKSALQKGDFRRLAYWNMFGRKPSLIGLSFIVLVVGIFGIYFSAGNTIMLGISIVLTACPVVVVLMMEMNIASVRRGGDILRRTSAEYTFGPGGVSARSIAEKAPSFYEWKHIWKVHENKLFFMFFINKVQMLTVRKTDLAPEEEETLRRIVKSCAPYYKPWN